VIAVRLAWRTLAVRPWRTLFLLSGYAIGVAVMIVLLSIGDAMMAQARDERLVGGGSISVLPEGLDLEVMKTGGLGGMYFSIPNARFVHAQVLASPRLGDTITAVAPQIEGKLLYLRRGDGPLIPLRATGEVPSASAAVGAAPRVTEGAWADDDGDRRWLRPTDAERLAVIDAFHETPPGAADRDTWAEWHYFNVRTPDAQRWAFLTFAIGGDVPAGEWAGQVLLTWHEQGRAPRTFVATVPRADVRYHTDGPDLALGSHTVRVDSAGRYHLRAAAREQGGGATATVELTVVPRPRMYFPNAAIGGDALLSGYAVPVLQGAATGRLCVGATCTDFDAAPAYHDHNWGTWRQVAWEWGVVQAEGLALLYGRVERSDSTQASAPLFAYLADSLGFRALFRPRLISYEDGRAVRVGGRTVQVPSRARFADLRGGDTLFVDIDTEDAHVTDTRTQRRRQGEDVVALPRPYFVQLKGRATLRGRVGGQPFAATGTVFFETYR
jgi:hypothetical protein